MPISTPTDGATKVTGDASPAAASAVSASDPAAASAPATAPASTPATFMVGGRAFRVLVAIGAALATFLVIGLPTDIIANPIFGRDVPVRPWELPVLVATSVLTGLYFGLQRPGSEKSAPAIGGAGLAMFAVACPVCNKVILMVLGTSGALGFWQPLQPFLAAVSLVALAGAVLWAWRRNPCGEDGCDGACAA